MSRRVFLPMVDRRVVLRGLAATLLASLSGCRIDLEDGESSEQPDGGVGTSDTPSTSPGFERCGDQLCIDLAVPANAALRNVDGARVIAIDGKRILIVRTTETTFLALSAICTHSGCTVRYAPARNDIECPCHGSRFAISGRVTNGPAELPLAVYAASYDEPTGIVTIAV